MSKIVGIVVDSETSQGDRKDDKGKWTRYAFQVKDTDGQTNWWACFDSKVFGNVKEGKAYVLEVEDDGQYKNLKSWKEVDATEYGLEMPAPVSNGSKQDEFRRSKVEMRWTEAYHMATRLIVRIEQMPEFTGESQKIFITQWAEFFYGKLEHCEDAEPTPAATQTTVQPPSKQKVTKTTPTEENPVQIPLKEELFGEDMRDDPKVSRVGDNYMLLKKLNDARFKKNGQAGTAPKEHTTVEQMNKHAKKLYEVDTVRDLTQVQMNDLIEDIEAGKAADKRKTRSKTNA